MTEKVPTAIQPTEVAQAVTPPQPATTPQPATGTQPATETAPTLPPAKKEVPAETAEAITQGLSDKFAPILEHLESIYAIIAFRVFSYWGLTQLVIIIALGIACWLLKPVAYTLFDRMWPLGRRKSQMLKLRATCRQLVWPVLWLITLWIASPIMRELGYATYVMSIATSLLNAWIFIGLITSVVKDPFWAKAIAIVTWVIAALNILRLLNPTIALLDSIAVTVGETRFSLYLVIKGALIAAFMLWFAASVSQVLQARLSKAKNLSPSVKVLIGQLAKFGLLALAVVVALNSVGIDLTALAVLSGAIGVGIGFGLQKIVSNLISGIILLSDRSIKPGDVIDVGGVVGWVTTLGARYTSVRTRDGTEHLIPNEELIINQVVNWSHSDKVVRRKIPIGIHYNSDLLLAKKLIYEAIAQTNRILEDPRPNVLLRGFGDSSVELEARIWINDPEAGLSNVASELLENVWFKFKENKIEIPYPQQDLHLRSAVPIETKPPNRSKAKHSKSS